MIQFPNRTDPTQVKVNPLDKYNLDLSVPHPEGWILANWGSEKSGKTDLALRFLEHGPVFLIDFDYGSSELLDKTVKPISERTGHQFYRQQILMGLGAATPASSAFLEYRKVYDDFLVGAAELGGTIVQDTFTQVRQLIDNVKLEEVKKRKSKVQGAKTGNEIDPDLIQMFPFDYSEANNVTGALVRVAYEKKIRMVLIHRATNVYNESGQETPELKMQGWKEIPGAVSMVGRHFRDDSTPGAPKFMFKITASRSNPALPSMPAIQNPTPAELMTLAGVKF